MSTLVAGKPRLKVVTFDSPRAAMRQLSSPVGLGSLFAVPSVQALAQSDTSALVAWIDTGRSFTGLAMAGLAGDPTAGGGDIYARLIMQDGRVLPSTVPGFPIRAGAQCLQLGSVANRTFVAWAGSERTGVRIALLPLEKEH